MAGDETDTVSSSGCTGTEIDEEEFHGKKLRFKKEVEYIPSSNTRTNFLGIFEGRDKTDHTARARHGSLHPTKGIRTPKKKSTSCCVLL
ncbi:hypothetical protein BsWGS_04300 [Bradybaena similaris]